MFLAFPRINAATTRVIALTVASALLLAAGDVSTTEVAGGPNLTDAVLAPVSPADARAAAAALAETTPAAPAEAAADAAPVPARPASLAALVASMDDAADVRSADLRCLASAVYFESRGEPLEGQLAVAQAIVNRAESGRYADTVCGVLSQPGQFSYNRSRSPRAGNDWAVAKAIAAIALQDMWREVAPGAMSFHASYVRPNWQGRTRVAQIGRHVFYR
ncbi:MAG: cell wall hydrolase [Alphaproteobacteria bacterium PA4]|nr:MAG: cell wall hydrolase [Alphaproteobacteria bacterium PA4]